MFVLISRLPPNTTKAEILALLNPALTMGFFFKIGVVESLELAYYRDSADDKIIWHSLARIEPDSAAKRVIRKLHRKRFNGMRIHVREYQLRCWQNDQRLNKVLPAHVRERRKGERRQHGLEMLETKKPQTTFVGEKTFHRTF